MDTTEIKEAKRELITQLQTKNQGILGGGIRLKNGEPCIVVFVSKPDQQHLVPSSYRGNEVITEVRRLARAY